MTAAGHAHDVVPTAGPVARIAELGRTHALWAAPLGMMAAALVLDPRAAGPTLCPFALVTGMACPGCGLTRAAGWLVRGDMGAAWTAHPLILVVAAWGLAAWVVRLRRAGGGSVRVNRRVVDAALVATAAVFVVTWVVRIAAGSLPPV